MKHAGYIQNGTRPTQATFLIRNGCGQRCDEASCAGMPHHPGALLLLSCQKHPSTAAGETAHFDKPTALALHSSKQTPTATLG